MSSSHTIVKYLPEWFPGASFKRSARISRESIAEWVEAPFEYVKKSMVSRRSSVPSHVIVALTRCMRALQAAGTAAPSMVSDALSRIQDRTGAEAEADYLEKAVKEACASAYAGKRISQTFEYTAVSDPCMISCVRDGTKPDFAECWRPSTDHTAP